LRFEFVVYFGFPLELPASALLFQHLHVARGR
jgi:hypothetical protein